MSREVGERYACEQCGAELVYTRPCPCGDGMRHEEICCGTQMTRLDEEDDAPTDQG